MSIRVTARGNGTVRTEANTSWGRASALGWADEQRTPLATSGRVNGSGKSYTIVNRYPVTQRDGSVREAIYSFTYAQKDTWG